jgi:protocatechuate 3,4-dioxygenase beta subunit
MRRLRSCAAVRVTTLAVGGLLWVGLCVGQTKSESGATGIVTGRVVQDSGGQGIRKVVVELRDTEGGEVSQGYKTATDAAGGFRIEGVEAGKYNVEISRTGFIPVKKGEWSITVSAGKESSPVVYKMQAAGVISGKVVDGDGDPVGDISVDAMLVGKSGVANPDGDAGRGVTNDLGEYRIANLKPGQYVVIATPPSGMKPTPNPADKGKHHDTAVYVKTYYPGTLDGGQAGPVQVISGGTVTANVGILSNRAYHVSGKVSGLGGAQMSQIVLVARGVTTGENLGDDGKFEFQNVQPGTYEARVLLVTGVGEGARPTMKMEMIRTPIVVDDTDVSGLDLVAEAGGTVKGKFRTEDETSIDWTQMVVKLLLVPESAVPSAEIEMFETTAAVSVDVDADGAFAIEDVPAGTYQLAVAAKSEVYRDYYVKSLTESGREVADTGFALMGGAGLEVLVSGKGCAIQGTVTGADGKPEGDADVVAIPVSGQRMRPDAYQTEKTNSRGEYSLRGLNPGQYVVVAVEGAHADLRSADFFKRYGGMGEQVDLGEGEKKTVGLKVVEAKE